MKKILLAHFCLFLVFLSPVQALQVYTLKEGSDLVGEIKTYILKEEDTLLDVARAFDLGYNQIVAANPDIDPWIPPPGKKIIIPSAYVLPNVPRVGIIINLAEMRLYYFRQKNGAHLVYTSPVGVGKEGYLTELGIYTIVNKAKNPTWFVPASIRAVEPDLPERVPPGPDNPLGDYIMHLSRGSYAIHGTNKPWGVGRRVSHGCIRLYPEDIEKLFPLVNLGTPVNIIYQPIKVGRKGHDIYVQVFRDFEKKISDPFFYTLGLLSRYGLSGEIDFFLLRRALKEKTGVPVLISRPRNPELTENDR